MENKPLDLNSPTFNKYIKFSIIARNFIPIQIYASIVDLGALGVTCSPRDPRFAGSNLLRSMVFFRT